MTTIVAWTGCAGMTENVELIQKIFKEYNSLMRIHIFFIFDL